MYCIRGNLAAHVCSVEFSLLLCKMKLQRDGKATYAGENQESAESKKSDASKILLIKHVSRKRVGVVDVMVVKNQLRSKIK